MGSSFNRIRILIRRDARELALSLLAMGGCSEKDTSISQEELLTRSWPCWSLNFRLPASRTLRNYILLFQPPNLSHVVIAA